MFLFHMSFFCHSHLEQYQRKKEILRAWVSNSEIYPDASYSSACTNLQKEILRQTVVPTTQDYQPTQTCNVVTPHVLEMYSMHELVSHWAEKPVKIDVYLLHFWIICRPAVTETPPRMGSPVLQSLSPINLNINQFPCVQNKTN